MKTLATTSALLGAGVVCLGPMAGDPPLRSHSDEVSPTPSAAHVSLEAGLASPRSASLLARDLSGVVQQYCVACHNDQLLTGNLSLQGFDVEAAAQNAETAESVILKVRAGMMPPPGMPRPGGDTLTLLAETLEQVIDDAASARPHPGTRTFQLLNRAEYERAVEDLLGLDVEASN